MNLYAQVLYTRVPRYQRRIVPEFRVEWVRKVHNLKVSMGNHNIKEIIFEDDVSYIVFVQYPAFQELL
jgi:hypothetical protein